MLQVFELPEYYVTSEFKLAQEEMNMAIYTTISADTMDIVDTHDMVLGGAMVECGNGVVAFAAAAGCEDTMASGGSV